MYNRILSQSTARLANQDYVYLSIDPIPSALDDAQRFAHGFSHLPLTRHMQYPVLEMIFIVQSKGSKSGSKYFIFAFSEV
jgi:hypothetical protein